MKHLQQRFHQESCWSHYHRPTQGGAGVPRKTNKRQATGLEFYSGGGISSKHLLVGLLPINLNIGQILGISDPLVAFIVVHEELVADNSQRSNHDHELLEVHFAILVFIQIPHDVVDHHLIPVGLKQKGGLQEVQPPLLLS